MALAAARRDHDAAVPVADGHVHHLCAVYGTDLLAAVERQLAGDRLRVGLLLEGIDVLRVDATALPHPESLRNLNTDEAYRQALAEPQPRISFRPGSRSGRRRWVRPSASPRRSGSSRRAERCA